MIASLAVHVEAWVIEDPISLVDHGESGVAFDVLCDNLYEAAITIFPGELAEIEVIGRHLNTDRAMFIHELVGDPW